MVAEGGQGGRGNARFLSNRRRAPAFAEQAEKGEELWLDMELKLMADVALVGFPNAGKSTLISTVSAAKPKIADYPFTTLSRTSASCGSGGVRWTEFVMADIPGLIEGAAKARGWATSSCATSRAPACWWCCSTSVRPRHGGLPRRSSRRILLVRARLVPARACSSVPDRGGRRRAIWPPRPRRPGCAGVSVSDRSRGAAGRRWLPWSRRPGRAAEARPARSWCTGRAGRGISVEPTTARGCLVGRPRASGPWPFPISPKRRPGLRPGSAAQLGVDRALARAGARAAIGSTSAAQFDYQPDERDGRAW